MDFITENIRNKNYIIIYIFIIALGYYIFNKIGFELNNIILITIIIFTLYLHNIFLNKKSDIAKLQKKNISDKLNIKYIENYDKLYNKINNLYHKYYKYNKYAFDKALLFMEKFLIGLENYDNINENIENLQFSRQNFLNNLSNIVIKIPLEKEDYFNTQVELLNKITLDYLIQFSGRNYEYINNIDYFRNDPHFIY
jgi:hypothetical protein